MIIVVIIAALYFGRDVFVPMALSLLLSFALAPPVRWLRRIHLPRIVAVLTAVALAFAAMLAFATVVGLQLADLAQRLPSYQQNIESKIESFREGPPGGRFYDRLSAMMRDLGRKIDEDTDGAVSPSAPVSTGASEPAPEVGPKPVLVEVYDPEPTSIELLQTFVTPLFGPLATAGIVIVFVIFVLLKREDLRDRLIRLAGAQDLSRTTEAIDDAARRVGHYLLMQLVVNLTYGIPVAAGLWLIGVPNAVLWGMLATVLRFIPYIGPVIAAFFPLALAIAVDPGWDTLLWTGGLLIVIELISNNVIEPWLYGSSTGLSPVAIIAAAIFWTWLWGPIGLLLSTPLTVCLVVLGQHVPQLAFLDVLFGSEPVLTPVQTLYQRLLVGDPDEATQCAEDHLQENNSLQSFYDDVALPALALAEFDRKRGVLEDDRQEKVMDSAMVLVENLADLDPPAAVDRPDDSVVTETAGIDATDATDSARPFLGDGRLVLSAAARGSLDQVAAAMLAQLLGERGANVRTLPSDALQSNRLTELPLEDVGVVVLSYMNPDSIAHARFLIRRLRRKLPRATFIAGFWSFTAEDMARGDPAAATGADKVVSTLAEAVEAAAAILEPPEELDEAVRPQLALASA